MNLAEDGSGDGDSSPTEKETGTIPQAHSENEAGMIQLSASSKRQV